MARKPLIEHRGPKSYEIAFERLWLWTTDQPDATENGVESRVIAKTGELWIDLEKRHAYEAILYG